jgi:hypothetical protein
MPKNIASFCHYARSAAIASSRTKFQICLTSSLNSDSSQRQDPRTMQVGIHDCLQTARARCHNGYAVR